MLVLSRKVGERFFVDDDIIVEVLEIDRGRCRLGIVAPPDVLVLREELRQKEMRERERREREEREKNLPEHLRIRRDQP